MALMVVAVMLQASAPQAPLDYQTLTTAVKDLGLGGAAVVLGSALAISVTLQPLQFRLVQLIEGYWSLRIFPWLFRLGVWRQGRRRSRAEADLTVLTGQVTGQRRRLLTERMLAAEVAVRTRFPAEDRLLPTTLGNVLRSAEDRVPVRYGLDSVVIWPRLFPLLPESFAKDLEDEVTQLDVSIRLTVTWAAAGLAGASIICLHPQSTLLHPAWVLIPALLMILSRVSYRSAIESALAHGQDIEVALDLYRDKVLEQTRMPEPIDLRSERQLFGHLCSLLQQYHEDPRANFRFRKLKVPESD
jgi:hypothetical protein